MSWNVDHIGRSGRPRGIRDHARRHEEGSVSAIEKVPRDKCMICDEMVELFPNGNGHLRAYDQWPNKLHRHPEAAMGEGAYRRANGLPDGTHRDPSEAEVREILGSTQSPSQIGRYMQLDTAIVQGILKGEMFRLDDVDYEAVRLARSKRKSTSGNDDSATEMSEAAILEILWSAEPNMRLSKKYSISMTIIHQIRRGLIFELPDFDYDAAKRARADQRKKKRPEVSGKYKSRGGKE
jgi:hypothetical protein